MAVLALAIGLQARADEDALETREILATGDDVPGLGRIGQFGVSAYGIDDQGRLLIGGQLTDGRAGIFWADSTGVVPLWISGEPGEHPVALGLPSTTPLGVVTALGYWPDPTACSSCYGSEGEGAFVITPGPLRPVIQVGDHADDGSIICWLYSVRANDNGSVAVLAEAASHPGDCYCRETVDGSSVCPHMAIYVLASGTLHRVLDLDQSPAGWKLWNIGLLGLTRDGAVVASVNGVQTDPASAVNSPIRHILSVTGNKITRLLSDGVATGDGTTFQGVGAVGANSVGDIAFVAQRETSGRLYRTVGGRVLEVTREAAQEGEPVVYGFGDQVFINDRGDVSVHAVGRERGADGADRFVNGIILYREDQSFHFIAGPTSGGLLNNAGDVVVDESYARDAPFGFARWHDGALDHIIGVGDPAPGGATFGAQGLDGPICLGGDGRVGVVATAVTTIDGMVCIDAAGPQLVVKRGDRTPTGGAFYSFGQCGFSARREMLFFASASTPVAEFGNTIETAIYRATPGGLERIVGPGDVANDGSQIWELGFWGSGLIWERRFAVNSIGTVAVSAVTNRGVGVFRRRADSPIERVLGETVPLFGGRAIRTVKAVGLAEDDTVVALIDVAGDSPSGLPDWRQAIVAFGSDGLRVLVATNEALSDLGDLFVNGSQMIFSGVTTSGRRQFRYRLGGSGPNPLHFANPSFSSLSLDVADLAADGRLLLAGSFQRVAEEPPQYGYFTYDGGNVRFLTGMSNVELEDMAINARGHALGRKRMSPFLVSRQSLHLGGPPPEGNCFPVPQVPLRSPPPSRTRTATPTVTPTPTITPTPPDTPTPLPTPCLVDCGSLVIDDATGVPGGEAVVVVRLQTGGRDVTSVQNRLALDEATGVALTECRANETIDTGSIFHLDPSRCRPGKNCTRARVYSLPNNAQIVPDGVPLYTCTVTIPLSAPFGTTYPVTASVILATDRFGQPTNVTDGSGRIIVAPPTATPTATATPTETPTPTPTRPARLQVGSTTGQPGDRVKFAVTLHTAGNRIVAAQNDIHFGAAGMSPLACRANPDLNKNLSGFSFHPYGCTRTANCEWMRALILAFDNLDLIPDGATLYTCTAQITATANPGTYPLIVTEIHGSDPDSHAAPIEGVNGELIVTAAPGSAKAIVGSDAAGTRSAGCAVASASPPRWLLMLPPLLWAFRRRRRPLATIRRRPFATSRSCERRRRRTRPAA